MKTQVLWHLKNSSHGLQVLSFSAAFALVISVTSLDWFSFPHVALSYAYPWLVDAHTPSSSWDAGTRRRGTGLAERHSLTWIARWACGSRSSVHGLRFPISNGIRKRSSQSVDDPSGRNRHHGLLDFARPPFGLCSSHRGNIDLGHVCGGRSALRNMVARTAGLASLPWRLPQHLVAISKEARSKMICIALVATIPGYISYTARA